MTEPTAVAREPAKTVPRKKPSRDEILALPKAELHCHLDGSLRLETVVDEADRQGIQLPSSTEEELRHILLCGRQVSSLEEYLEAFRVTLMVLQDASALERAAFELAEDCAAENVRYLEVRFSPLLHTQKGLRFSQIIEAVLRGLARAEEQFDIIARVILCGMRHMSPQSSLRVAELCLAYKDRGVVGFDLAGAERNYPPKHHVEAFSLVLNNNLNCTIHAGEGYGPESIAQAIHHCGAHRIGHGTRLREDGSLFNYVIDHRIPLEMCPTSNVQTRTVPSIQEHPFGFYFDTSLRVTINTDNRLMSGTTLTDEFYLCVNSFDLSLEDVQGIITMGFKSVFLPFVPRRKLLRRVLKELGKEYVPS